VIARYKRRRSVKGVNDFEAREMTVSRDFGLLLEDANKDKDKAGKKPRG